MLKDSERLKRMSVEARQCVENNYDWEKLWKQWEFVLDNTAAKPRESTWDSPIEVSEQVTAQAIPDGMSDAAFVDWLYVEVLKYPRTDPVGAEMWMGHLQQGVSREQLLTHFVNLGNSQSDAGNARQRIRAEVDGVTAGSTNETQTDWVE
jgi:hypothetical protein